MVVKSWAVKDTGRFLGFLTFAQSGGTFLGPIVGGGIYQAAGFRAVFASLLGIMGIDVILRAFMIEKDVRRQGSPQRDLELPSGDRSSAEDESTVVVGQSGGWGKPLFRSLLRSPRICTGLFGAFALVALDTSLDTVSRPALKSIWV